MTTNNGKKFEKHLEGGMEGLFFYRLRDSAGAWSGGNTTRFTPSNWCDYIIHFSGLTLLLEAKTTKGKSLPYSNLKPSQIRGFEKIRDGQHKGVIGMFAIQYQDLNEIYLIKADYILEHIEQGKRKSLEIDFVRKNGVRLEKMKGKKVLMNVAEGLSKCLMNDFKKAV